MLAWPLITLICAASLLPGAPPGGDSEDELESRLSRFTPPPAPASHGREDLQLRLWSMKSQFLLGEPVALRIAITNSGRLPTQIWQQMGLDDGTDVFVGSESGELTLLSSPRHECMSIEPREKNIDPGERLVLSVRVLLKRTARPTPRDFAELAITAPGVYRFQVRRCLWPTERPHESNVIEVRVVRPERDDEAVLTSISTPQMQMALWRGELSDKGAEKVMAILREHPNTGYSRSLRDILEEYYKTRRERLTRQRTSNDDKVLADIRSLLKLPPKEEKKYYADDARLDAVVLIDYPTPTAMSEIFKDVTRQSNITLRIDPLLGARRAIMARRQMTLRQFMAGQESFAVWVLDPDGAYRLVAVEPPDLSPLPANVKPTSPNSPS